MKLSRICALLLLVALGSAMAVADGINDPKIIIRGASAGQIAMMSHCPPQGCTSVGLNFTFGVPKSGSGTLFFTNNSGVNWTSLTLVEKGVPAIDISCSSYLFPSCKTETLKNGAVAIVLATSSCGRGGIKNGQSFSIQLACVGGSCWPGGLDFSAHANGATPEPGTIAFMTTGLAAIVSRRKWWTKRSQG
ncbi:MAG: PEP-CTERM sorting domain-containing protein [Terriglobales bacterium]